MQTSGLVLDVYDDFSGAVLREVYPSFETLPAKVKEAHVLSSEDRQRFPDDTFALVLVNGNEKLRKFACIDEGNTVLSLAYFMKTAHKLPLEAQKVAAENLKVACGWYDIEVPPALEKIALGFGTALAAVNAAPIISGTSKTIKENMAATRALEGAGQNIVTPGARDALLGRKTAETSGTDLMPNQAPGNPAVVPSKTVTVKSAGMPHQVKGHAGEKGDFGPEEGPPYNGYTAGKNMKQMPQAGQMHSTVDVTNAAPPKMVKEKKASAYALPALSKYPLDSYAQVKAASAYFDEYYKHMGPATRHEYAVNLVKAASSMAIPVSDIGLKYGSEDFAPEWQIKAAFDTRRLELVDNTEALALLDGVEKVSRSRIWKMAGADAEQVSAETCVDLLAEFDKVAGLDHNYDRTVPDPYFSILGFEKSAEADPSLWSDTIANDSVNAADLQRLAKIGAFSVKTTFGDEFGARFQKDPIDCYKSVPLAQKKMLMRMANSTLPGVERTYY